MSDATDVADAPPTEAPAPRSAVEPLGTRFGHLLAATGLSNLADGVLMVGVPLLALTLTRSPSQIALVSAATTLPWLLLALPAGVLIDRHDRVRVLVVASAARIAVLVMAAGAALTGTLTMPVLLLLLLLFGAAEVFADSTAGVLVPAVVPRARLGAANSRLLGLQQLANAFVGGPSAGVVLGLGSGWLFGIPAALCVAAVLLVVRGLSGRVHESRGEATAVRAELVEGLRYLWGHRVVRPLLLTGSVLNFASAGYFAVFVLWVVGPQSRVGMDPDLYGVLLGALAVGALLGAVLTEALRRHVSEARLITSAWLLNSLLLLVPVLVPEAPVIGVAFVVLGLTNMVGNVVGQSLRQRLVPGRLLGRVGGASRMLSYGCMPLGAAVGGVVGETVGLPAVFVGAVVVSTAMVLWVIRAVPQRSIDDVEDVA